MRKTVDKTLPAPSYLDHRERLKKKYRSGGIAGWHDYEVLEFALTYALPRKDTKEIAKELLGRFKTLGGVLNAELEDLASIRGISTHSALFLRLLKDVAERSVARDTVKKNVVSSPDAALRYLRAVLKDARNEEFHALFLDAGNRLITPEKVQTGTVTQSAVYPRMIAERSLHHRAAGVIIAHNHPGGTPRPSEDDLRSTEAVNQALAAVGVRLLDHIIIAGDLHFSWKERGLL